MESNGPQLMTLLPRYKSAVPGGYTFSSSGTVSSISADSKGRGREKDASIDPYEFSVLMMASESGVLSTLTPLSESSYARLASLSSQLMASLPVLAGTNPKAYRTCNPDLPKPGVDTAGGRVVVDGCILRRWNELGSGRRAELAGKGGYDSVDDVRAELDALLGWCGLPYY
jgi:CPSF A subunit-like protein